MPQIRVGLVWLSAALLSFVLVCCTVGGQKKLSSAQTKTSEHTDCYSRVIDARMPLDGSGPSNLSRDSKWLVTVRILPPFGRQEVRLSLKKSYTGNSEGSITTPKGRSLFDA